AAGVVADHAAEGAAAVGGRVGAEGQAAGGGRGPEVVQDDAGLDDGGAGLRVERDDPTHMAGEVQYDAGAGGLSGDAGAAAAGHDGDAALAADLECSGDVLGVPGGDYRVRDPAVVGRVHRHQCTVG